MEYNMIDLDQQHLHNPQAGDYWHDRFCPVALVIDSGQFFVAFLHKKKDVGKSHWTWDTSDVATLSKQDFVKKMSYSSMDKPWANVVPNWKHWKEFAEDAFSKV